MCTGINLILIALAAQVNAQDNIAAILGDRAFKSFGYDDAPLVLDVVTLAKPQQGASGYVEAQLAAKKAGAKKPKIEMRRADGRPGKVFGGTNKLLAGKGMPSQAKGPAIPSYWGGKKEDKGVGYGWSLGLKGKKGKGKARAEPERVPIKAPAMGFAPVVTRPLVGGRPLR